MLLLTYDITDDKLRTKFSEFIQQYGDRVQYSVYKIKNSDRVLNNIQLTINKKFAKRFSKTDSVYIFAICEGCKKKVLKFGNSVYEDKEVIYF